MKRKKLNLIDKDKYPSKYFIPENLQNIKRYKFSCFDIEEFDYLNNQKLSQEVKVNNEVLRCEQIKLTVTPLQKNILLSWIESARLIYTITVKYLRSRKDLISFFKLRPIIKTLFTNTFKEKIKDLPVHIIDNSIKDVLKAYKTSIALLKSKHIKFFRIRYKKQNKPKQTIVIEQQDFSVKRNGFYVSKLGNLKSSKSITRENIKHDTRLTYDKNSNKFLLNNPINKKITKEVNQYSTCSIDPGNITFATIYNPEGNCKKLFTRSNTTRLSYLLNKKLSMLKCDRNKKSILRVNRKIYNFVKEVHYKTANYLCSKYQKIYLGKLSTQSIVQCNMSSFEKNYTHALSHFKFSMILLNKCIERNKTLHLVDESYTSKTCGNCGYLNDVGFSRVYNCLNCNLTIDRDFNGARNILIKNS
jgi:transposase